MTKKYEARRKCLVKIVEGVDKRVEEDGFLDIKDIDSFVAETMGEHIDDLNAEDILGIHKYVDEYIGILKSKKGIEIKGYMSKTNQSYLDPFDNSYLPQITNSGQGSTGSQANPHKSVKNPGNNAPQTQDPLLDFDLPLI